MEDGDRYITPPDTEPEMAGVELGKQEVLQYAQWLDLLLAFCGELILFVDTIPENQDPSTLIDAPEYISHDPAFSTLFQSSKRGSVLCTYNSSVPPSRECEEKIRYVHMRVMDAIRKVGEHRALSKFRPEKPPLFFDRTLWVCMALAVQHLKPE